MDSDRFDKYYNGAQAGIEVALWNVQQLMHGAESAELETLARQARYSLCASDTLLQLLASMSFSDEDGDDDDDDGDEEEEIEE